MVRQHQGLSDYVRRGNVSRKRTETILALIAIAVGLLLTAIAGLFSYISLTAVPLHPDPQNVPSVTHSVAPPKWADAVEQSRQIIRASLAEQNLPGASVAVGAGGDIVWAEGFGYSDLEKKTSVGRVHCPDVVQRSIGGEVRHGTCDPRRCRSSEARRSMDIESTAHHP